MEELHVNFLRTIAIFIVYNFIDVDRFLRKRISSINVETYIELLKKSCIFFSAKDREVVVLVLILFIRSLIMRNTNTEVVTINTTTKAPERSDRKPLIAVSISNRSLKRISNSREIIRSTEIRLTKYLKLKAKPTTDILVTYYENKVSIRTILSEYTKALARSIARAKHRIRHI